MQSVRQSTHRACQSAVVYEVTHEDRAKAQEDLYARVGMYLGHAFGELAEPDDEYPTWTVWLGPRAIRVGVFAIGEAYADVELWTYIGRGIVLTSEVESFLIRRNCELRFGTRGRRRGGRRRQRIAAHQRTPPRSRHPRPEHAGTPSLPAIPRFLEVAPGTAVVMLTMQDEPGFARAALNAGASAYVVKASAEGELVDAVRAAAAGGTYLTPALGASLAKVGPRHPLASAARDAEPQVGSIFAGHRIDGRRRARTDGATSPCAMWTGRT